MGSNQALDIKNKEFMLIGGLLIIVAGLMAFFPSLNDSDTTVDWISLPLVGFPIIVSCILLAFFFLADLFRKDLLLEKVVLANFSFARFPGHIFWKKSGANLLKSVFW